jgi:hypothetical protein
MGALIKAVLGDDHHAPGARSGLPGQFAVPDVGGHIDAAIQGDAGGHLSEGVPVGKVKFRCACVVARKAARSILSLTVETQDAILVSQEFT